MTPFVHHHIVYHRLQLTARLVGYGGNSRRLVLIPVGNGGQVEGQAIVVPMLNGGFQPFLKEDGILNKEPIDMCTPQESDIIIHTWIAEVDMLVGLSTGWKRLTFTAAFIYIVLIFLAAYPRPLIERPEYFIPYMALSVMVLSFYVVFITNIIISEKVYRQSLQLKEQQKWFRMAYVDALTEIPNRMAYMEKVHELERAGDCTELIAVIMMDMDNFKKINDTLGHNAGDEALKHAAKYLSSSFSGDGDTVYRVGGDEFAAIVIGADKDEIVEKLKALDGVQKSDPPFSISYGYSFVDRSEDNAVNQAFKRADAMMYVNKTKKSS